MLGADFAQALQVAHGRNHHAGRATEGLDDDGGDVAGVVQRDQIQQAVGQGLAALGRLALGEGAGGRLGVGQVIGLDALAVDLAVGDHAADRDAAEVDAVVALLAANQARLAALALQAPVSARHLQRRVGGFGAAGGEEHVIEPRGRQAFQLVGQLERQWVAELERGRIVELRGLLAHGLGDLAPAMAEARAPQAREAVEHLAAIGVGEVGALRGHDHARVALELAVGGEGHPVRVEPGGVLAGGRVGGGLGGGGGHAHGLSPSGRCKAAEGRQEGIVGRAVNMLNRPTFKFGCRFMQAMTIRTPSPAGGGLGWGPATPSIGRRPPSRPSPSGGRRESLP